MHKENGFTMVELLVTIAVAGILAAVAVPGFFSVVNTTKLATQSNELLTAMQFARSEAIRSNAKVTFCGAASPDADADDDCSSGEQPFWVVIGKAAGGGQEQLRIFAVKAPTKISTDLEKITFSADGLARDPDTRELVTGEITVCLETRHPPRNKRVLNIASGSRVAIETPTEDGNGSCT
jgi:type IV fimbrial biogenesis protein FimT